MGARDYSEDGHVSTYNELELYANCICIYVVTVSTSGILVCLSVSSCYR